jgi:hypothetical protein
MEPNFSWAIKVFESGQTFSLALSLFNGYTKLSDMPLLESFTGVVTLTLTLKT